MEEHSQEFLEENNFKLLATSNIWINTPIVELSVKKIPFSSNYIASCTIKHFDLESEKKGVHINSSTVPYEINFYVDDKPMGGFNVTLNSMEVFTPLSLPTELGKTVIGHGTNVEFPSFDLHYYSVTSVPKKYQCSFVWSGLTPTSQGGNKNSNVVVSI